MHGLEAVIKKLKNKVKEQQEQIEYLEVQWAYPRDNYN